MPASLSTPLVLGLGAFLVLLVLVATGRHHRGAIAAAMMCGVILAGVSGCGAAIQRATGAADAPVSVPAPTAGAR